MSEEYKLKIEKYSAGKSACEYIPNDGYRYSLNGNNKQFHLDVDVLGNLRSACSITAYITQPSLVINTSEFVNIMNLEKDTEKDVLLLKQIFECFKQTNRSEFLKMFVSLKIDSKAYKIANEVLGKDNVIDNSYTRLKQKD